jgi:hypothetical protein
MAHHLEKLKTDVVKLAGIWDSSEFHRARTAALLEAVKSTQREKIRLLGAVLAGFIAVDMEGELKSRAFSKALSLWPSDVVFLKGLDGKVSEQLKAWDELDKISPEGRMTNGLSPVSTFVQAHLIQVQSVESLGCYQRAFLQRIGGSAVRPEHHPITALGRAVLELVKSYDQAEAEKHE